MRYSHYFPAKILFLLRYLFFLCAFHWLIGYWLCLFGSNKAANGGILFNGEEDDAAGAASVMTQPRSGVWGDGSLSAANALEQKASWVEPFLEELSDQVCVTLNRIELNIRVLHSFLLFPSSYCCSSHWSSRQVLSTYYNNIVQHNCFVLSYRCWHYCGCCCHRLHMYIILGPRFAARCQHGGRHRDGWRHSHRRSCHGWRHYYSCSVFFHVCSSHENSITSRNRSGIEHLICIRWFWPRPLQKRPKKASCLRHSLPPSCFSHFFPSCLFFPVYLNYYVRPRVTINQPTNLTFNQLIQ